jgi:4-hydroxybenzoate polyprenyltransferase
MIRTIFNFIKIEHTIFSLPLVFAGAYAGANYHFPDIWKLLLVATAATGARAFGMAMNRILDRKIDAKNKRTRGRDIPSGRLTVQTAYLIALLGLLLYVVSCILLGPRVLALSPIPAIVLAGYSLLKRFTWLCHYGIGVALGIAPAAAYVAVSGSLDYNLPVLLISGFTLFWISGYDIIYALQDIEFDKTNQVFSIPGAFGHRTAQIIAASTHLLAFALLVLLVKTIHPTLMNLILVSLCGGIFIVSYLPWIPLEKRFFPLSSIAGILGAGIIFFG